MEEIRFMRRYAYPVCLLIAVCTLSALHTARADVDKLKLRHWRRFRP